MKRSTKTVAKSLEEKRLKNRTRVAEWRRANPESAKQHYRRYWLKKAGRPYPLKEKERHEIKRVLKKISGAKNRKNGGS